MCLIFHCMKLTKKKTSVQILVNDVNPLPAQMLSAWDACWKRHGHYHWIVYSCGPTVHRKALALNHSFMLLRSQTTYSPKIFTTSIDRFSSVDFVPRHSRPSAKYLCPTRAHMLFWSCNNFTIKYSNEHNFAHRALILWRACGTLLPAPHCPDGLEADESRTRSWWDCHPPRLRRHSLVAAWIRPLPSAPLFFLCSRLVTTQLHEMKRPFYPTFSLRVLELPLIDRALHLSLSPLCLNHAEIFYGYL